MSANRTRKLARQDKSFFTKLYRRRKTREEIAEDFIVERGGKPFLKKKLRRPNWQG